MSQKSDHQRIWAIAWPSIIAGSSAPMVQLVDTWALGHLPDAKYLAAVAFAAMIFSYIFWAFGFLRMGTTGLIAQSVGQNNDKQARKEALARVMARSIAIGFVIALGVMAFQGYFLEIAKDAIQPPKDVFNESIAYYDIRIWSALSTLFIYGLNGYLIGTEQSKLSLKLTLGLNIANGGLNILFVVVLNMGVAGVALGTLIADWSVAIIGVIILFNQLGRKTVFNAFIQRETWQAHKVKKLLTVNTALFIRTLLLITALAMITRAAAAEGASTMAAAQILSTYMMFIALGLDGFAYAAEALAGSAYGAKDRPKFRSFVLKGFQWAFGAAILYTLVFGFFSPHITAILTPLADVQTESAKALMPLMFMPIIAVFCFQFDGIYIGATATWAMMVTMLMAFIPYAYILPIWAAQDGINGIWWALCLFMALRGIGQLLYYPILEAKLKSNLEATLL